VDGSAPYEGTAWTRSGDAARLQAMHENHTLVVESAGAVLFPESVREKLGLRPGDILSVEGAPPDCFTLEIYRELLTRAPAGVGPCVVLGYALRFLARPLTAVEEDQTVRIPPEVFPLPAGSRLTLFLGGELCHHLQMFVDA
jgi:hypothetical protein